MHKKLSPTFTRDLSELWHSLLQNLNCIGHDAHCITAYTNLLVISNIRHEIEVVLERLRKMRKFESASAV